MKNMEAKAHRAITSPGKEWKRAKSWTVTKATWEPLCCALGIGKIDSDQCHGEAIGAETRENIIIWQSDCIGTVSKFWVKAKDDEERDKPPRNER
jgi:hypothetical protein